MRKILLKGVFAVRMVQVCGFLGLSFFVWSLARSVTILNVFHVQEKECRKYYTGLLSEISGREMDVKCGMVSPDFYRNAVVFSEANNRVVVGETLKRLEDDKAFYLIEGTLGLLVLGGSAFLLGKMESVSSR